jgi:hypothetical protein
MVELGKADKEIVLSSIADVLDEIAFDESDKLRVITGTSDEIGDGLHVEVYINDGLVCRFLFYDILLDENEDILSTKDVVECLKSREGWSLS